MHNDLVKSTHRLVKNSLLRATITMDILMTKRMVRQLERVKDRTRQCSETIKIRVTNRLWMKPSALRKLWAVVYSKKATSSRRMTMVLTPSTNKVETVTVGPARMEAIPRKPG